LIAVSALSIDVIIAEAVLPPAEIEVVFSVTVVTDELDAMLLVTSWIDSPALAPT